MSKIQCRLCENFFDDKDMSEEHYPAHSVGNDDVVKLDVVKFFDSLMGEDGDLKAFIAQEKKKGTSIEKCFDKYFDNFLAEPLYPKGRTARTLCQTCNRFLGKYDEAYLKFYAVDGNPKIVKGFQQNTRLQIIKAIYAKFLSVPEAKDERFDFINFVRDPAKTEYNGKWRLYFVKRDYSTDLAGLSDIPTGKIDWNMDGKQLIYELCDDKFIYDLMNFEKHEAFEMNNIFDILGNYKLVVGCHDATGGYHGQMMMSRMFGGSDFDEE